MVREMVSAPPQAPDTALHPAAWGSVQVVPARPGVLRLARDHQGPRPQETMGAPAMTAVHPRAQPQPLVQA
jgi:hypothetical protein